MSTCTDRAFSIRGARILPRVINEDECVFAAQCCALARVRLLVMGTTRGVVDGVSDRRYYDCMLLRLLAVFALTIVPLGLLAAQGNPVGGWLEDYARLLQLTGQLPVMPVTVRPLSTGGRASLVATADAHVWSEVVAARTPLTASRSGLTLDVQPLELRGFANTNRPWGWNDGAVWQGKGLTVAAQVGVEARWGPVSVTLAPVLTRSSNHDFNLSPLAVPPGLSEFAYPTVGGTTLDAPQRFGREPVQTVDWGNSNIRATIGPVAMGLSHESLWWGPGMRNDVLLTNNAPGFWHAQLSLVRPVPIGIGTVTGRWIWGSLRESAFFDTVASNNRRYVTGAAVSFVPRWGKGLELGAARLFQQTWTTAPGLEEILWLVRPVLKKSQASADNPTGEDASDQMASVFVRWALPASGLELYGEWAKGDHSYDFRDLFVEPEHASGYLLGLQKVVSNSSTRTWRVTSELTILGAPRTTQVRSNGAGFFYVHGQVVQGYTHRGQVLGAGIGPGSSQLSLGIDRFSRWGKAGVLLFRTVYDNDRYYRRPNLGADFVSHEVEPSVLFDAMVFRGAWDFTAAVTVSRLLNQWYFTGYDQWNTNVSFGARYHPSGSR